MSSPLLPGKAKFSWFEVSLAAIISGKQIFDGRELQFQLSAAANWPAGLISVTTISRIFG